MINNHKLSAVGFEPTSANTEDLESSPLDLSGTLTSEMPFFPAIETGRYPIGSTVSISLGIFPFVFGLGIRTRIRTRIRRGSNFHVSIIMFAFVFGPRGRGLRKGRDVLLEDSEEFPRFGQGHLPTDCESLSIFRG